MCIFMMPIRLYTGHFKYIGIVWWYVFVITWIVLSATAGCMSVLDFRFLPKNIFYKSGTNSGQWTRFTRSIFIHRDKFWSRDLYLLLDTSMGTMNKNLFFEKVYLNMHYICLNLAYFIFLYNFNMTNKLVLTTKFFFWDGRSPPQP